MVVESGGVGLWGNTNRAASGGSSSGFLILRFNVITGGGQASSGEGFKHVHVVEMPIDSANGVNSRGEDNRE